MGAIGRWRAQVPRSGRVKLYSCNDIRAERWSVVNP